MRLGQPISLSLLKWHTAAAIILGSAMLTSCSGSVERATAHGSAADQALQAGRIEVAREEIQRALDERDDLPELFLIKGRIELAGGSDKRAYAAYANALALDTANLEALQGVSQLGLRTGNLPESLDAAERLLVLQPNDANTLVVRGVHAFLKRRFEEAVDYADRALASQPDNEAGFILKSRSLFLEDKPGEALEVINSAPGDIVSREGIVRTKLELYREMHDPKGMQEQFDRLRQLAPDDLDLRIDEADLHYKLGDRALGRSDITKVLSAAEVDRDTAESAVRILQSYGDAPTKDQVRQIARDGSDVARTETARLLTSINLPDRAEIVVASLPPGDNQPLSAQIALLRGDADRALAMARAILASDETNCDALTAAAGAMIAKNKGTEAQRDAQRAAGECPGRAEPWLLTAKAYAMVGANVNVERVFRDALEANPQNLALTTAFANWLMRHNRGNEAEAVARLLTRKAPSLLKGWQFYRSVCERSEGDCAREASAGVKKAQTLYGPDPKSGTLPPEGLFGRLVRR